jgi:LPS-assembly protein
MKRSLKARLLLLTACASALGPLPSGATAATAKPGDDILMRADEIVYDVNKQIVTARGHVEIDSDQRILLADQVTYDQTSDTTTARGHVSLTDAKGNVMFADHLTLTDQMREGALEGFAALIGKSGRMAAASAQRSEGRFIDARHAVYTPCKICNQPGHRTPVWQVKSYRVVYDQEKHRIHFSDATLEFFGVPVLYSPYLSEPDPTVKYASGLLTPDIGSSSFIGSFVRLPIYIALSPNDDATLSPLITTRGGDVLQGEYRERSMDGGLWLQASGGYNPNGGISGTQDQYYAHLFGSGRIPLSNWWRAGFDLQLTSNETYLKRYDISQLDRLENDLFIEGESGRSRFAVTGYFFQGLRATDDNRMFPVVLPLIQYTYIPEQHLLDGQFRFDVNSIAISRNIGTNDQRMTAEARWRKPFVLDDGELLTFQLDARGDLYHISNAAPLPPNGHFVSRGMPYAAIDWRWPFVATGRGDMAFVIEPITQFILAPYGGNPAEIAALDEDSVSLELNENSLFSFDQLPGYDLVEGGPRANVGVRAEASFPSGYVEALVGQSYRLKPDTTFAPDSGLSGTTSDIVARFSIKFPPYVDLTHRVDLDGSTGTVRRNEVYLTGTYGRSSLQVSYVQLAPSAATLGLDSREEVNAQADINFYKNWQVFAAARRDLIAGQMLDSEMGLGYEDECLGFSIAYRRKYTSDRDLPPSTAVILHINLKTGEQEIKPFSLLPQDVFSYTRP